MVKSDSMTERAFLTETDRRTLIASRALALKQVVESLPMRNDEQKIRLVQELLDLGQNSDTITLPWSTGIRTELRNQIVDHDPAIGEHPQALERILDLLEILEADIWPIQWYAVPSHSLHDQDRSEISALIDSYVEAYRSRNENAFLALMAVDGVRLELQLRRFKKYIDDPLIRVERLGTPEIIARFDGRTAVVGTWEQPPVRLQFPQPDGSDNIIPVDMRVVRSLRGWRLW